MSKLLILLLTFFLLYTFLKKALKKLFSQLNQQSESKEQKGPITDQLVQDPVCGVYCPKREAITLKINSKKVYFCSTECKNKFLSERVR